MKSIFNSLGSNYSFGFSFLALRQIFSSDKNSIDDLREYLDKTYRGKSFLFYKGRDAIEFSLRVLLGGNSDVEISKQKILTQAFSCFAIEEGIKRAGMTPAYVDIQENSTNMSVETLQASFSKNKSAKAVLVQHSLGIPADILAIKKWCKKNNLVLIEDLAQSIGGVDSKNQPLGEDADVIIFSFGRDKIIDAVSGGAVVFKKLTAKQLEKIENIKVDDLPKSILIKEMIYPLVTLLGRKTYDILIGKIILKLAKIFKLISSPIVSSTNKLTKMNLAYAKLALFSFDRLDEQILKRRKIANFYFEKIDGKRVKIINSQSDISSGSNLRFSIRVDEVDDLIDKMKASKIYISDRWYREAVDCGEYSLKSAYVSGSSKNAEKLASEILNLPTHRNISLKKAGKIVRIINTLEGTGEF